MAELPIHIDSTMITSARSCLQKFKNSFVLGRALPGVSIDLHAGACYAAGLEETYLQIYRDGRSLDEALIRAHARFMQEWGDVEVPDWKRTAKNKDRVWEAVEHYFIVWPPHTDYIKPYRSADGGPTLEYTFAIPLEPTSRFNSSGGKFPLHPSGSPFLYCGRFDMLGSISGRPTPKDDKTTGGSIGQSWAQQWNLRNQFMGYIWACRQCNIDASDVLVRGMAIQKTQFTTAEALIPFSQFMLDRWHEQLRRTLWDIVDSYHTEYWDYNFGDTCTQYGLCPFMDACQSSVPENWLASFETRHWNPLQKDPSKEAA